jgi:putative NIF3 family GTP cyclohydrolase 1 type 2
MDPSAPDTRMIAAWLDDRLDAARFRIEEPENGLIVDAGLPVNLIASAVNTSFGAIARAVEAGANLLLVHHASWSYIDLALHQSKLTAIRDANLSLYCAHASLDCAAEGTGRALSDLLGIEVDQRFAPYAGGLAGVCGPIPGGWDALLVTLTERLGTAPEAHRNVGSCERVGIVPGAGGQTSWLQEAKELGCDTYLTGEGSMYTRLFAKEAGINLILAGHDLTEAPGIEALGRATASQFRVAALAIREPHIG